MLLQRLSRFSPAFIRSFSYSPLTVQSRRTLFACQSLQQSPAPLGSHIKTSQQDTPHSLCKPGVLQEGFPLYNLQSVRQYRKKKTVKIPPTKPLSFDFAGDLVYLLPPVDPNAPKPGYEEVEDLKSADQRVKNIFSLGFADGQEIKQKRLNELLAAIQEHPADVRSLEVDIATKTLLLRNMIRHVSAFRKDKVSKRILFKRIHRRNNQLRRLRTLDMEKFEWLLQQLQIKFIPKKTYKEQIHLSKRAMRKKIARDGFFSAKKEKLAKLRERLEAERVIFEKEKDEALTQIRKDLDAMGITEFESVDSVLTDIGMEKYMEVPEKRMKRRYLILAKKFALHEEREKAKKLEQQQQLANL